MDRGMTKTEILRDYFIQHPDKNQKDAERELEDKGLTYESIRVTAWREVKRGFAKKIFIDPEKKLWRLDYTDYYADIHAQNELAEWKREISITLVEQLLKANETEKDSDKIRLNAKTISQIMKGIQ